THSLRHPGTRAVMFPRAGRARVASNVASGATGYAMFVLDNSHSRIVHNRLTASEHGFAVGGTGNVVRGNVVTNSLGRIDVFEGAGPPRGEVNRLRHVGGGGV